MWSKGCRKKKCACVQMGVSPLPVRAVHTVSGIQPAGKSLWPSCTWGDCCCVEYSLSRPFFSGSSYTTKQGKQNHIKWWVTSNSTALSPFPLQPPPQTLAKSLLRPCQHHCPSSSIIPRLATAVTDRMKMPVRHRTACPLTQEGHCSV